MKIEDLSTYKKIKGRYYTLVETVGCRLPNDSCTRIMIKDIETNIKNEHFTYQNGGYKTFEEAQKAAEKEAMKWLESDEGLHFVSVVHEDTISVLHHNIVPELFKDFVKRFNKDQITNSEVDDE